MTNSLSSSTVPRNFGVYRVSEAQVDITSLDSAGTEPWDPDSQVPGVDGYDWVVVIDQEDYAKFIHYDHSNDQFIVKEVNDTGDGTGGVQDVANNTDVGTVTVLVLSRR